MEENFHGDYILADDGQVSQMQAEYSMSLKHISETTRHLRRSYEVVCLKKKSGGGGGGGGGGG
ncbi:MAG: hypothetical protein K2P32_02525, partial [Clostridia bacterium]|nr:hypothetical protein [Clostridia bacterium]